MVKKARPHTQLSGNGAGAPGCINKVPGRDFATPVETQAPLFTFLPQCVQTIIVEHPDAACPDCPAQVIIEPIAIDVPEVAVAAEHAIFRPR
jgi:hypothetical protein